MQTRYVRARTLTCTYTLQIKIRNTFRVFSCVNMARCVVILMPPSPLLYVNIVFTLFTVSYAQFMAGVFVCLHFVIIIAFTSGSNCSRHRHRRRNIHHAISKSHSSSIALYTTRNIQHSYCGVLLLLYLCFFLATRTFVY